MSEQGYKSQPLGNAVARHIGGGTPPRQVVSYWNGAIPWASVKDFPEEAGFIAETEEHISTSGLNASASNLIPAGTPLVCTRMAVGRAALPAVPMAINQDVKALFPAPGVSPAYLLKLLQFAQAKAESQAIGSTVKGIRIQDYLGIPVPLAPLEAQPVIASVLSTLDNAILETEKLVAKLKSTKQGLLHDLLTRGIDDNGELRPVPEEAPHFYSVTKLGCLPKAWNVLQLGECAEIASGLTLGRGISGSGMIELPYLRVANVQDGYVDLTDVKTARILPSELERFALRYGDVLMNEGGDFDKLGRGTVWQEQISPCLHQNHVFRVRCDQERLLPNYLAAYSASSRGKAYFVQASKQTTNLASINSTQLKAFEVACPSIGEQRAITQRIAALEVRETNEMDSLCKLKDLRTSLMDDLLTGRKRVTALLNPTP